MLNLNMTFIITWAGHIYSKYLYQSWVNLSYMKSMSLFFSISLFYVQTFLMYETQYLYISQNVLSGGLSVGNKKFEVLKKSKSRTSFNIILYYTTLI